MKKIPLLEQLAAQSLVEYKGELIFSKEKFAELIVRDILDIVEGYCETSPEIYGLPLDIVEHFDMEIGDDDDII
jgi:hypothetical protein